MTRKVLLMTISIFMCFAAGIFAEPVHYEPTFSVKKHASALLKEKIAESGTEIAQMSGTVINSIKTFVEESGLGEDLLDAAETLGKDLSSAYGSAAEKMSQVYEEELKKDVENFLGGLKSGFDAFSETMKKEIK